MAGERQVPWCIVFLVVGALTGHTMVLIGNLATSYMLHDMGSSTNGWSIVGVDLAGALRDDLEPAMDTVSSYLTEAIEAATEIQKSTDVMLSIGGSTTDGALAELKPGMNVEDIQHFKVKLMRSVRNVTGELVLKVTPVIDRLLKKLDPALKQVEMWLASFGSKIQAALEQFGTTIDRVQKIFDQVLSQVGSGTGHNEEYMVYNTFTLFDTDRSGAIHADDLQNVATIYDISALQGDKSRELVDKYDTGGEEGLDPEEYTLFVNDPSIPGIMTLVLRTYSRKLADIGGLVGGAKMRDEVASAVTDYFMLVCGKNLTRVEWLSQALTNGSLPIQFTADVIKELASAEESPNKLSVVAVGPAVLKAMVNLNGEHVARAVALLGNASFWASEGFDGATQPSVLGQVAGWLADLGSEGAEVLDKGLGIASDSGKEALVQAAYRHGAAEQDRYLSNHAEGRAGDEASLYASKCSQILRDVLLGGTGAAAAGADHDAETSVRGGQKAQPATLKFAQWLANNATDTAHRHLHNCFDYTGQSSGALESFANQVNSMVSKTKNFLNLMTTYASPKGQDRLIEQADDFGQQAAEDIVLVCEEYIDSKLAAFECEFVNDGQCNATLASPRWLKDRARELSRDITGAFNFITTTVGDLKGSLPTVIKDLKFAKKGVSSVSNTLNSVMTVLGLKAPPLFYKISGLYKAAWVAYFIFFVSMTLGTLFYGFWAAGYFGGPDPSSEGELPYDGPRAVSERLRTCWRSCGACVRGCQDSHLCFWSILLLCEVFVLILFVLSIVICVVGGVQAFLRAGCSQVYILGDDTVCTTAMEVLNTFLKTFGISRTPVEDICHQEKLMTCRLIADQASKALITSVVGAVLATLLSCQMIVESAVMHERARYRGMIEKLK
mmetsp:Transcript_29899/g.86949  ORF Transcript_29899/g.86949 Transcript_29899/m.86949 type:complete len:895 (+) Transcript_29899:74-2758(+)